MRASTSILNKEEFTTRVLESAIARLSLGNPHGSLSVRVLAEAADLVAKRKEREVQELYRSKERLQSTLLAIKPIQREHGGLRLFTPSYQRLKKGGD